MPVIKSQIARELLGAGDAVGALRIVKDFRLMTPEQRRFITRAWAVRQNPSFYRQMGYDLDDSFALGIGAMREVLGVAA